jgi:hypothetical protein
MKRHKQLETHSFKITVEAHPNGAFQAVIQNNGHEIQLGAAFGHVPDFSFFSELGLAIGREFAKEKKL